MKLISSALRIHLSPECKAALDLLGGFHLEERGPVTMKVRCHAYLRMEK